MLNKNQKHTSSSPPCSNCDNTGGGGIPSWCCVYSWKTGCISVRVEAQTATLGAGEFQHGQIMTSTLTLVLPVYDHLLRSEGLL